MTQHIITITGPTAGENWELALALKRFIEEMNGTTALASTGDGVQIIAVCNPAHMRSELERALVEA